jgi:hypothetical protein
MQNLKKFFLSFLVFVMLNSYCLILNSPSLVWAVDLSVTCDGSSCNVTPGGQAALFSENNILPGQSFTRKITAVNNGPDNCNLLLDTKNEIDVDNFTPVLFTVIKDGGSDLYGIRDGTKASSVKNLDDVFSAGWISLGSVGVGGTRIYDWTITMNPLAGNEYQARETTFDFDINFSCGVPSNPSNPGSPSNPSAPTCSDATPGAPTNLVAIPGTVGQVILSWSPPSAGPYTYFLVAYSDSPSWPPKWGNPNVGNVTNYTVSGLGTGSYWFWVRSGNGCQPGPYIGPVAITIAGISGVVGPAEGFLPGVLGEQENLNTVAATQAAEVREVKGAAICKCFWWPILLLGILAEIVYLILGKVLHKKNGIFPLAIALITFAAFWYFNRNCPWILWPCRWFWLLDLIIYLLTVGIAKKFLREN